VKFTPQGYVLEYAPDHPAARNGWVSQHRLVWEREVGPIPEGFVVHHKNEDKADNRLENLALFETNSAHSEHHWRSRWRDLGTRCTNLDHLRRAKGRHIGATAEQAVEVRRRVEAGEMQKDVAKDLGLTSFTVSRIWTGKTFRCQECDGAEPEPKKSALDELRGKARESQFQRSPAFQRALLKQQGAS
jgi:hypothetical protein